MRLVLAYYLQCPSETMVTGLDDVMDVKYLHSANSFVVFGMGQNALPKVGDMSNSFAGRNRSLVYISSFI